MKRQGWTRTWVSLAPGSELATVISDVCWGLASHGAGIYLQGFMLLSEQTVKPGPSPDLCGGSTHLPSRPRRPHPLKLT